MTHYICTGGCEGVTDTPNATCQATDCAKHEHPLTPCDCTDGSHAGAYAQDENAHSSL